MTGFKNLTATSKLQYMLAGDSSCKVFVQTEENIDVYDMNYIYNPEFEFSFTWYYSDITQVICESYSSETYIFTKKELVRLDTSDQSGDSEVITDLNCVNAVSIDKERYLYC